MKDFEVKTDKLEKLSACSSAIEYVKTQSTYLKAWQNCERGDWMLWIAKKLNVDDRKLTMAKYHCASQVIHLMKDQRSLDAMTVSLKYANSEITREELNVFADAADATAAAYVAYAYVAYAAAAAAAARKNSLKQSADICRQYLTKEVLTKYKAFK